MKLLSALLVSGLVGLVRGLGSTDTITWGGDNSRTGYQTNHNMDPAIVGSPQFGQIFKTLLPGRYNNAPEQIFSQPLVYTPSGGTKQYVYFATTQNNLYKLDAMTGEIVASRNLHIPFLTADLDGCVDVNPCIGVTATGVIDPSTDTLYLTAKTYLNQNAGPIAQGRPAGRYYVHAIDVNNLKERSNFPVDLEGLIASNNPTRMFTGGIHHQRPGLLHTGQYIYAGFASHCVQYNFTGWIIGWDKTSGKVVEKWATEGKNVPNNVEGGGIWQSGGGLASDNAGSMYFATGNGYASQLSTIPVNGFEPPTALEQAAVHMSIHDDGRLSVVDFFMPYEKQELDGGDKDLGTSPLELLPSQFSCGDVKRIGVVTGKSGKTYWLNLDNLGGYRNGPNRKDKVLQTFQNENSVYAGAGVYPLEGGYIYINVIQYPSHVFKFSCTNGVPYFTKVADSPTKNAYILGVSHGTTTSLNGQEGTGLLWVTDVQNTNFKIYDAVPKDGYLVPIKNFTVTGITKFTRPVFGDGMAYFGTTLGYVYGFGSLNKTPLTCTSPMDFGTADIKEVTGEKTVTCKALFDVSIQDISLLDNTHYTISSIPTMPLALSKGQSLTFKAKFSPKQTGRQTGTVAIETSGGTDDTYSKTTRVLLTGSGKSSGALLSVTPQSVSFSSVVTGTEPERQTVLLSNEGSKALDVSSILYSLDSISGPWTTLSGTGKLRAGQFLLSDVPTTIPGGNTTALSIEFDTSKTGDFKAFAKVVTTGGNGTVSMTASAGYPPQALFEFQKPDGSGWVKFDTGNPFTFGNVTENNSKSLKFRITNNAPAGGVKLSLTVSKPPFAVNSIVRAANQVDLAEGTSLAPGQSQTATLTCTVPKSQWNMEPFNGTAQWNLNTNDPDWEKQYIKFFCNAVTEQAAPLLPNGLGRYRYVGCFKENNPGRQLSNLLYGDDKNTNEVCIKSCAAAGSTFCGTQYRRECWGGNRIPNTKVDDKNCNFDCANDLNQICGGNGIEGGGAFISLFADTLKWDGNFATISETGPVVNPGVNGYTSMGCYTEATSGRALNNGRGMETATIASCVKACKAGSFTYAGAQYGGECFCGDSFAAGSVPAAVEDCRMPCNDNSTEYCGGPSRLNVYKLNAVDSSSSVLSSSSTTKSSTSSSSSASVSSSSLSISSSSLSSSISSSSVSSSSVSSSSSSSSISTLSSSSQSASSVSTGSTSSSSISSSSTTSSTSSSSSSASLTSSSSSASSSASTSSTALSSSTSSTTSSSSSTPLSSTSTSSTSSSSTSSSISSSISSGTTTRTTTLTSTSTTSSTTTTKPSPTGPEINQSIGSWDFQGCWTEGTGIRALNMKSYAKDDMTLESCASFCEGYDYFGAEYAHECFCGNKLNTGSVKAEDQKDCSFTCAGNKMQYCGAGNRLQLYKNAAAVAASTVSSSSASASRTSTSSTPIPTPTVFPGNMNFTNYSCVAEPSNGRVLSRQILNDGDNMTIATCLEKCWNYKYAGVEYGRECWCGNDLNFGGSSATTPGKNVSITDCDYKCPGNKYEYCGAGSRINMYINNSTHFLAKRCEAELGMIAVKREEEVAVKTMEDGTVAVVERPDGSVILKHEFERVLVIT